jgi:hypothetical protein
MLGITHPESRLSTPDNAAVGPQDLEQGGARRKMQKRARRASQAQKRAARSICRGSKRQRVPKDNDSMINNEKR